MTGTHPTEPAAGEFVRAEFKWARGRFAGIAQVVGVTHTGGYTIRPHGWTKEITCARDEVSPISRETPQEST